MPDYSDAERELFELRAAYVPQFNERDLEAIVALYEDDSILLPPTGELLYGPDGSREVLKAVADIGAVTVEHGPVTRLEIDGDLAYTIGCYFVHDDNGPERRTSYGRSLEVWRRNADGEWKDVADMWHELPPGTEPAGF